MSYSELSPIALRVALDVQQTYEAYREARRCALQYAGGMAWKSVGGREYLVKIVNRRGGMRSLGLRCAETEAVLEAFVSGKARARERERQLFDSVRELGGMARGVHINRVPSIVTATLRKLDDFGLLGKNLMVIGTHAMYGYEAVAGVRFDAGLLATGDMDLLWDARTRLKLALLDDAVADAGVLAVLRKVDKSFEPLTGAASFRAVNKSGFLVDLVKQTPAPPWKAGGPESLARNDLKPAWLPKMHWLLSSQKFHAVVIGQDGLPAPLVCPDPRAFAVFKKWLSDQPDREPMKRRRDDLQAEATMALVQDKLPHLVLDEQAVRMFPQSVRVFSRVANDGEDDGFSPVLH